MLSNEFPLLSVHSERLGGKPCVVGTRITVEFLLELVADGATRDEIVAAYQQVSREAVEQALRYAAQALRGDVVLASHAR